MRQLLPILAFLLTSAGCACRDDANPPVRTDQPDTSARMEDDQPEDSTPIEKDEADTPDSDSPEPGDPDEKKAGRNAPFSIDDLPLELTVEAPEVPEKLKGPSPEIEEDEEEEKEEEEKLPTPEAG